MQNPLNDDLSSLFNDKAIIAEGQRIHLAIESMNSPRITAGYVAIIRRQRGSLDAIHERLDVTRESTIRVISQEIVDKSLKKHSTHLRPKHLPRLWRSEVERNARRDAESIVARAESQVIKDAEHRYLKEQQRYLDRVQSIKRPAPRFDDVANDRPIGPRR